MTLVRFNRNYPSLFDRFFDNDMFEFSTRNFSSTNTTLPSVNIKESNQDYVVEVAAPGLEKSDFKIELKRNVLTVSSEKQVENETKEGEQFTRREFSYQSFSRSFTLPEIADGDKIAAKYENGILSVSIPKKEEIVSKLNRMIEIQ